MLCSVQNHQQRFYFLIPVRTYSGKKAQEKAYVGSGIVKPCDSVKGKLPSLSDKASIKTAETHRKPTDRNVEVKTIWTRLGKIGKLVSFLVGLAKEINS